MGGPYGVSGALPPDSAGSPHASPYGGLVRYRRTQAGSPRASPYNGSPIRGAIGGLRYLWYSNSME
ncbi:hypothetical protein I3300191I4_14840 [Megasphaera elsdenii]